MITRAHDAGEPAAATRLAEIALHLTPAERAAADQLLDAALPQTTVSAASAAPATGVAGVPSTTPADAAVGDILATPVTGAYGHSMGSNYQKVQRPPVVFVSNGDARLVVRRETLDDLVRFEV